MKTDKKPSLIMQMATPLIFAGIILMHACFFFRSGAKYPDLEVTNSIFSRIASPILIIGLLLALVVVQMYQMQARINKLEELLDGDLPKGDTKV